MQTDLFLDFRDWLAEEMQDEGFRTEYERLKPGFEVAKLRMRRGLTQAQLAKKIGTHQSSISRLESGAYDPSITFLRRVVEALDGDLTIRITAKNQVDSEVSKIETSTETTTKDYMLVENWPGEQPCYVATSSLAEVAVHD